MPNFLEVITIILNAITLGSYSNEFTSEIHVLVIDTGNTPLNIVMKMQYMCIGSYVVK